MTDTYSKIDLTKTPKHVAIIMDGNGRWAKNKGKARVFGHTNGVKSVREVIDAAGQIGVKAVTLYAFSTENWNRPKTEVKALMSLLLSSLKKEVKELIKNDIRLKIIGDHTKVPEKVLTMLNKVAEQTRTNKALTLTIALSYGSRQEITATVKDIASKIAAKEIDIDDISESLINASLSTNDLPEVDLLIRTSGEQRISNFLLWQIAYAELYFTETLWPDFKKDDFFKAILEYQNRERRFGKTSAQIKATNEV